MSMLATVLLLAGALQAANDAEAKERDQAAISAATEGDAGADFVSDTSDSSDEEDTSEDDADHPEARLYDASIDATAAVDNALAEANTRGVNVLLVLGANWCHDSRAFAGWSESERIGGLIADRYELVFINVGMPQTEDGHNLHIAQRFELGKLEGTPTVAVVSPAGEVLNRDTAKSWRNAASRGEDKIYEELASLATAEFAAE